MASSRYERTKLGDGGVIVETGTTAITGQDFSAIQLLTDTTFSSLTEVGNVSGDAMTGIAIKAPTTIYGKFTGFTLTSGAVRAYRSVSVSG